MEIEMLRCMPRDNALDELRRENKALEDENAELKRILYEGLDQSCNACSKAMTCECRPAWGQPVRLRCPLFKA